MRGKTPSSILRAMDDARLTVTLELRIEDDCITGLATGDDGRTLPFDGWLGLLSVLDELVLTTTDATSRRDQ
jgi:hypothetical protein